MYGVYDRGIAENEDEECGGGPSSSCNCSNIQLSLQLDDWVKQSQLPLSQNRCDEDRICDGTKASTKPQDIYLREEHRLGEDI